MKKKLDEAEVVAKLAAKAIDDKKGEEIKILDLRGVESAPAEFFVIASGNVPSHVSALSDNVFELVKKATGYNPHKIEGYMNAEWILMDYFDVVVHIFLKDKRDFYRLDQLWSDGKEVEFERTPEAPEPEAKPKPKSKKTTVRRTTKKTTER